MGFACAGVTVNAFLWYDLNPPLATLAGNCSYFLATANTFNSNHANVAGAVIYSTNVTAMTVGCMTNQTQDPGQDCPGWNADAASANTVGAGAVVGYGPGLAFPPHSLILGGNSTNSPHISYISDGSTSIPMPLVNALDQAGNVVNLQPLRANVSVSTVLYDMPSNSSLPQLPGQTQASADAHGDIELENVVMIASPGDHNLLIGLSDLPQVNA